MNLPLTILGLLCAVIGFTAIVKQAWVPGLTALLAFALVVLIFIKTKSHD